MEHNTNPHTFPGAHGLLCFVPTMLDAAPAVSQCRTTTCYLSAILCRAVSQRLVWRQVGLQITSFVSDLSMPFKPLFSHTVWPTVHWHDSQHSRTAGLQGVITSLYFYSKNRFWWKYDAVLFTAFWELFWGIILCSNYCIIDQRVLCYFNNIHYPHVFGKSHILPATYKTRVVDYAICVHAIGTHKLM